MPFNPYLLKLNENSIKDKSICLPVASRWNLKYNIPLFNNESINEDYPEIDEDAFTPEIALDYLSQIKRKYSHINSIKIIGPRHPFASPEVTLRTLELVRSQFPDMQLIVVSNGLNLLPYIYRLVQIKVDQVNLVVNAIDPKINSMFIEWARYGQHTYYGEDAAKLLIDNQLSAIARLKSHGITINVSSILVESINDNHIEDLSNKLKRLNVNRHVIIPMKKISLVINHLNTDNFKKVELQLLDRSYQQKKPDYRSVIRNTNQILKTIIMTVQQMPKADDDFPVDSNKSQQADKLFNQPPLFAVISRDGLMVDQDLSDAERVLVFNKEGSETRLIAERPFPKNDLKTDQTWLEVVNLVKDCSVLFVKGVDLKSKKKFIENGIKVIETQGTINNNIEAILSGMIPLLLINFLPYLDYFNEFLLNLLN